MSEDSPPAPPAEQEQELSAYVIEGARSSRSRCKICRRPIEKGTLRIGYLIEGPFGTGYLWHHLRCSARRHFDRVDEAYAAEAWNAAKQPPEEVPPLEQLRKLQEQAEERKRVRKEIPYAESAPSGRAKCKRCEELIEKGSLRVTLGRGVYFGSQVRTAPINVHTKCAVAEMKTGDCLTEAEGFAEALRANSTQLTPEQVDAVLAEIGDLSGI
jgi:hypothetical protein